MPITSILGHREIAKRLLAELRSRPSHAYLFAGPRGVGKALVATSLVHAMMCERSPGENGELESGPHFTEEAEPEQSAAWEEIEVGRFMPRRTRGSYRGRALG